MSRTISIIKKEEAYSYDELAFLEEKLLPLVEDKAQKEAAVEVLQNLKLSLENQNETAAVFFMPQNTFNVFSLIQGGKTICSIDKENIESLNNAFNRIDACDSQPIYAHLKNKLHILLEYLQAGNKVVPVVIAADAFCKMLFN